MSYRVDILLGAAVDITVAAAAAKSAGGNVAQAEEATATVVLADDGLVALASRATLVAGGSSEGSGRKGEGGKDELHDD